MWPDLPGTSFNSRPSHEGRHTACYRPKALISTHAHRMRGNSSVGAEAISTYIPRMRDDDIAGNVYLRFQLTPLVRGATCGNDVAT